MKNYEDLHNYSYPTQPHLLFTIPAIFDIFELSWRMTGKNECHVVSQGALKELLS